MSDKGIRAKRRAQQRGFLFGLTGKLGALSLAALVTGCSLAEPPPPVAPDPVVLEGAPIREGAYTQAEAVAATTLLLEAQELLEEGEVEAALDRAAQVEASYASAPGSSLALWVRARALEELEDWADAEVASETYAQTVSDDTVEVARAFLLRARVRRAGNLPGGIEAVFEIPADGGEAEMVEAEELAALWASGLATSDLRDLIDEAPRHPRLLPVFITELAVRRYLNGDETEAAQLAEQALELSPGPVTVERATDVIEERIVEQLEVAAVIGGLLPVAGSPALSRLAREIGEGVEVALAVDEGEYSRPIQFVPVEDATDAQGVSDAIRQLEADRVSGLIGPLQEPSLEAAARSRTTPLTVISPTARLLPQGVQGVFSLNGVDPAAGEALASLVLTREIRDVVVIHAASQEMEEELRWFREAYARGGGTVSRILTYPPGATGFQNLMAEVVLLEPRGLVLLLPPEDVELLAPQIAFYGVDELPDLALFGNQSWTSEGILQSVQARSTEGVFSVTSWVGQGEFGPGWDAFVDAYEGHFQRSLRSPTPALGYDAARLLLRAAREGGGTAEGTLQALQRVQGFPGATGFLSVVDGRLRRSFVPVRIENRRLVLLTP